MTKLIRINTVYQTVSSWISRDHSTTIRRDSLPRSCQFITIAIYYESVRDNRMGYLAQHIAR